MFDWLKGALCLLSVAAMCAFTGRAAELPEEHDIDPIMHLISDFMLSTAAPSAQHQDEIFQQKLAEKLAEYDARIAENDKDNEAYVCRALTLLTSLSHDGKMAHQAARFGFNVLDKDGIIEFTRRPFDGFDVLMRENNEIDEACEIAVPVLKDALADLEKVSKDWTDGMEISEAKGYSVNETVYFDYADSLLTRAAISEMISVLYLMKGYNTLTADGQPKENLDLEALKESQRWMYSAAVQVNAFTEAASERDDISKNNFFMPKWIDIMLLRENAQNLVNVPYWTVRFDLDYLSQYLYLNGIDQTEEKRWKRGRLFYKTLDVSFRSLFEGKVRTAYGTFPKFEAGMTKGGLPILDSLADSSCGGMFPGLSRTELWYLLRATSGQIAETTDSNIDYYGVRYLLPEGAVNNPSNPTAFEAGLESAITLLYPTMAGYYFTGWTRDVVIRDGVIPDGTTETLVFTGRFAPDTSEGEEKQGTPDNPWEIGMVRPADVKAWLDDAGKLTIAGEGKMKDFTLVEAPWYSVRDSITALEIGSGVTTLGECAFNNCHELTSVTIPSSVGIIKEGAFCGCPLTRVIEMREKLPRLHAGAFGSPSLFEGTIFVPGPLVDSYKGEDGWRDYADHIRGMALVTLPPVVGYRYEVRDLSSEGAEIEPTEAGGTTYALPIGARVSIDVVAPGYAVTGESYVIDCVESGVILDESRLPRAVLPEGCDGDPWKIGATTNDTVVAWTNGTTLVVEGKGAMKDFTAESPVPWAKDDIVLATVGADVASLGNAAFADSPTGEGAEIVFQNPAAVINIGAFVGDGGAKTNVPAVKVETVAKDGQVRRIVPVGFRDVADRRKVYPSLQTAIDAAASAVTPRIRSDVVIVFR